jgi:hypothetical protein
MAGAAQNGSQGDDAWGSIVSSGTSMPGLGDHRRDMASGTLRGRSQLVRSSVVSGGFIAFGWCRPKHLYRLDLINVSRPQLKSQSLTVRRDRSSIRGTWISIVPTGNRQGVGILTWLPATVFYPIAAFKHCFLGQRSRCLPPVRTPSQARSRTKPSPMIRSGPTPLRLAPPDRTSGPLWSLPVAAILLPRRLIWSWGSGFLLPVSANKRTSGAAWRRP